MEARKALSAVYRTGQRFGAVHVIDVLRGKDSERIERWDHDKLSVFGIGADIDDATWRNIFRQLVSLGMLRVDHEAHGGLKLADAARAVLKDEQAVWLRRVVRPERARRRKSAAVDASLGEQGAMLLDQLKAWRLAESRAQAVPAYVILHDKTLQDIARARPRTLGALGAIAGIGAKKLERYGGALLGLVNA